MIRIYRITPLIHFEFDSSCKDVLQCPWFLTAARKGTRRSNFLGDNTILHRGRF